MPRFFFDVEADDRRVDATGVELADREAARTHAIGLASACLDEAIRSGTDPVVHIAIRMEDGEVWDVLRSTLF